MKVPQHVAIIMDGNGRWAQARNRSRVYGHVWGARKVKPIVREAKKMGVRCLTLFAFSTENWMRPKAEIEVLFRLLRKYLVRQLAELKKENVRLRVIGQLDRLPKDLQKIIERAIGELRDNDGIHLNLALSYGSRDEIVEAAKKFATECVAGKHSVSELTENKFWDYLSTSELSEFAEVDLLIRTSGEHRVSNFLLWQSAYAEFCFSDVCWPDFTPEHFRSAIEDFSVRERRFGKLVSLPSEVRA